MKTCGIAILFLCGIGSAYAQATTRVVTTIADAGTGSLRAAVAGAPDGTQITFDPALNGQVITLTSTPIVIATALTITGNGASNTRISGANARRLFEVSSSAAGGTAIRNLTLASGNAGNAGSGGAILNTGVLRLEGVRLTGNGAGISGGAVLNQRSGAGGSLVVRGSVFDANTIDAADCGSGAAIRSEGAGASVVIVNTTLAGNTAGPACSGGAIGIGNGSLEVVSSTLGPNTGGRSGGNLYKGARAATIVMRNTVLVEGSAVLNPDLHGAAIGFASLGSNLVGDRGDAAGFVASDLVAGTPPMLGALQPSGAVQLPARVPMAGSALLDRIGAAACVDVGGGALGVDQRGVVRPQGPACDIGAVERTFGLDELLFADGFE
jgi:hypothetical protein